MCSRDLWRANGARESFPTSLAYHSADARMSETQERVSSYCFDCWRGGLIELLAMRLVIASSGKC